MHRQFAGDNVERGGTARGENDGRTGEQFLSVACQRQILHRVHQTADELGVARGITGDLQSLVALDAGQVDDAARGNGARQRQRFRGGPTAGAPAGNPELEKSGQSPCHRLLPRFRLDEAQLRFGIDQEVELEIRIGLAQSHDLAHCRASQQLVGHQHAAHAEADADLQLLDRRDRDAPRARGELLREDLRRHGCLAVRRQQHAGRRSEVAHPSMIVCERRIADHRQRQRQVAGKHAPALRAEGGQRQRRHARRQSFGEAIDRFVCNGFEI